MSNNYLITPRSTVLLEKLTGSQLVKKFPTFHGTRKFINAFTSAGHLSPQRDVSSHYRWRKRHPIWMTAANILNKQLWTSDKG